ncbi:hypothetical protein ZEAMMB73_Zm00001d036609 [Zea mays]|uniref:Uncharacterized protein n=1 Tax=Zea mays TaxID=4577 RepID=A0A1D6LPT0_MAIZE|nr:hypothetical protein ZEAMMB73_Zm00001d036609 [Zea mays]AQK81510.1 hypothetical protein ZEAMMB73_Zm00001d036609 [Zea mays]
MASTGSILSICFVSTTHHALSLCWIWRSMRALPQSTWCSSLVFLALASIRSFLKPYWHNGLYGV